MPPIPTEGDWYLVVPIPDDVAEGEPAGATSVYVVQATQSELAAQAVFDYRRAHGPGVEEKTRAAVLVTELIEEAP